MAPPTRNDPNSTPLIAAAFTPTVDLQTYKNLVYLVFAFPLGFVYSMLLGLGFVFGIVLSVAGIGVIVLLALLPVLRALTAFERWLATRLLEAPIDEPGEISSDGGLYSTIRAQLAAERTWRGLGFLTLKFWLGFSGVLLLVAFSTAVSMISSVLRRPHDIEFGELNGEPVVWTVETLPEAALAVAIGVVLAVFFVHLTNGFAYVARRMAVALL